MADAPATQLAFDSELGDYFEAVAAAAAGADAAIVANWVTGELAAALAEWGGRPPGQARRTLAATIAMVGEKRISHGAARQLLRVQVVEDATPMRIAEREGLGGIEESGELEAIVAAAIEADPDAAEKVREGNMKAVGPLVGFVMRETKGRADGGEVTRADPRPARLCNKLLQGRVD